MFGLDYLISPHDPTDFLDRYWGQRSLFVPGTAGKFEGLFDWDGVNEAMNSGRLSREGVRLIHDKKSLPREALQNLDQWLAQGATLAINSVNQIDPVVGRFATALGFDLNTHVNINSYMSCPSKQGFDNHYDNHDVFVVQIAGRKAWTVFEPTRKWPLERDTVPKGKPPEGAPYLECELSPGDMIYVPRGHWHYAVAVTPSIHLTVGPQARTGIDLLGLLTQQLMDNDEFLRRDFPIARAEAFGGDRPDAILREHFAQFRQHMVRILESDAVVEAFIRYCMTTNAVRRTYQLPDTWTLRDAITPDTLFVLPADQKSIVRYDPDTRSAVVYTRGHVLNLNGLSGDLLAALLNARTPTSGRQFLASAPEMTWETLKEPLLHMFDRGVLELAGPAA